MTNDGNKRKRRITPHFLMQGKILDLLSQDASAWVSVRNVASPLELTHRNVLASLRRLEHDGLVESRSNGPGIPVDFRISRLGLDWCADHHVGAVAATLPGSGVVAGP